MKRERRKRPGLPPLDVQIVVALRQLREINVAEDVLALNVGETWPQYLNRLLTGVALYAGIQISFPLGQGPRPIRHLLNLDHDPMLRVREYHPRDGKPIAAWYFPHAHDPRYLRWRSKRPQDAGSHKIKTYVRGEHGQHADKTLAKRERRHEDDPTRWTSLRSLKKPKRRRSRRFISSPNKSTAKMKSRGFPPKGSRKINRRKR